MRSFFCDNRGGSLILTAVMLPLLVIVMAVVVDVGRVYAVQARGQNALDSALLGAVATLSTTDVKQETVRLFNANYPPGYMGSTSSNIVVKEVKSGVFEATYATVVPTTVVGVFSKDFVMLRILSQVTRGLDIQLNNRLELSMVLDNTGSMLIGDKIGALKIAANELTDILFGSASSLQNLHITVVPYHAGVDVGPNRANWVQGAYLPKYITQISNRNRDEPTPDDRDDFMNAPPNTADDRTLFRVPNGYQNPDTGFYDRLSDFLQPIGFSMNSKAEVKSTLAGMIADGTTRINVGLMWGWFTLSPSWQGVWDPNRPTFPQSPAEKLTKAIILMTDGQNTVFNGNGGTSNDDITTAQMCTRVKRDGIVLYVIGYADAGSLNEEMLRNCATGPQYYFSAPTNEDLRKAFQAIADDLLFFTIRLSK